MASEKLVITNIGQILSGKLEAPILDGDCVVSVDGRITDIGYAKDMDLDNADGKGSCAWGDIDPRFDRQPCSSGDWRLYAAPATAKLD